MRLMCPECNADIAAHNINVQKMVAVCGDCDAVFRFTVDAAKRKRRKVKQPPHIQMAESPERMVLRFQRVYNQDERGLLWGDSVFALLLPVLLLVALRASAPILVVFMIAAWMAAAWYVQAALRFNQTTITRDADRLAVGYGPLPWFTGAPNLSLESQSVTEIICEQTTESRESASSTRFYHVRARRVDGDTVTILQAMPEDYAFFIAQELNTVVGDDLQATITHLQNVFEDEALDYDEDEYEAQRLVKA